MGVMEKIKEIEAEMARTQKNKATNYHLGTLKAKLARLRNELFVEQSGGGGSSSTGEGFDVARNGDARVALIGFPSAGKSSLLNLLTATESEAAAYEFTTLTCIPGVLNYKGSKIQVLDLPGIIEGAAHGAGRGKVCSFVCFLGFGFAAPFDYSSCTPLKTIGSHCSGQKRRRHSYHPRLNERR
jgi:ribosome-interacting GTPase 1